jgi:hypothetical protein
VLRFPFCNEIIDVKREEKWCCGSASAMSVQRVQSMYSTYSIVNLYPHPLSVGDLKGQSNEIC